MNIKSIFPFLITALAISLPAQNSTVSDTSGTTDDSLTTNSTETVPPNIPPDITTQINNPQHSQSETDTPAVTGSENGVSPAVSQNSITDSTSDTPENEQKANDIQTDSLPDEEQTENAQPQDTVNSSDTTKKLTTGISVIDTTSAEASSLIVDESEEELILDGGEENIIMPVSTKSSTEQSPAPPVQQDSSQADAVAGDSLPPGSESTQEPETPKQLYPVSPIPQTAEDPPPPPKIGKMHSINFAKNLKEYRSPKVAILLSLLLPGAGQAYARNYLKTGIFGAVEIGLITTGVILSYKGSKKLKAAHSYADDHYDIDSFEVYYTHLSNAHTEDEIEDMFLTYESVDDFYQHEKEKNQNYYNYISHEVSPYIQGWDDVYPRFDAGFQVINDSEGKHYFTDEDSIYLVYSVDTENEDTTFLGYGASQHQKYYSDTLLSKANSYYRWSKTFFTLLILNHIASAIDAGITAKAYNDMLLGKRSLWQKINIREKYVRTPSGTANGLALEVRF